MTGSTATTTERSGETKRGKNLKRKRNERLKRLLLGFLGVGLFLTGCASGTTGKDPVTGSETGMKTNTETEKITEARTTPDGQVNREDVFNSYKFKNPWKTGIEVTGADGKTVTLREVTINIGGDGEPIEIYQLTDIHFNAVYDDEDATVQSSYKEWGHAFPDNETILATYKRCMNYAAEHADRIVLTGDLVNFYSRANYEVMENYIFRADETVNSALKGKLLMTSGNHDCTFPGVKGDLTRYENNHKIMEELYAKYGIDLEYTSQVIDERVMLVVLDNASWYDVRSARFTANQLAKLERDITLAREKGYAVLLFGHVPLPTKNTGGHSFYIDYDANAYTDATSKAVYDLITNSADVVKGYFTGHNHGDTYLEIVAKTPDGKPAFIPEYVLVDMNRQTEGGTGEMTRIILK